uniref:Uncharacterized protein n=1 Tax=Cyanoptyche gloeocystis TaxID=77922 RepID=A0A7S2NNB8_9EUKA
MLSTSTTHTMKARRLSISFRFLCEDLEEEMPPRSPSSVPLSPVTALFQLPMADGIQLRFVLYLSSSSSQIGSTVSFWCFLEATPREDAAEEAEAEAECEEGSVADLAGSGIMFKFKLTFGGGAGIGCGAHREIGSEEPFIAEAEGTLRESLDGSLGGGRFEFEFEFKLGGGVGDEASI